MTCRRCTDLERQLTEAHAVIEHLEDAIRDVLDLSTGWTSPRTDAEKLAIVTEIGTKALLKP